MEGSCFRCHSYYCTERICLNCGIPNYFGENMIKSHDKVESLMVFEEKFVIGGVKICPSSIKQILVDLRAFNLMKRLEEKNLVHWKNFMHIQDLMVRRFACENYVNGLSPKQLRSKLVKCMLS